MTRGWGFRMTRGWSHDHTCGPSIRPWSGWGPGRWIARRSRSPGPNRPPWRRSRGWSGRSNPPDTGPFRASWPLSRDRQSAANRCHGHWRRVWTNGRWPRPPNARRRCYQTRLAGWLRCRWNGHCWSPDGASHRHRYGRRGPCHALCHDPRQRTRLYARIPSVRIRSRAPNRRHD